MQKTAIIIGAGIGGLATALRLAHKGYAVQVFEANAYAGGKLTEISQDGYRWDAGPSLFTLPTLVDELLNIAGDNTTERFAYTRLPITCKYFYEDGTTINGYAKAKDFAVEICRKTGEHPQKVWAHLQKSKQIYEQTAGVFLERSLHKWQSYCRWEVLKSMLYTPFLGLFSTMHAANSARFSQKKVVQLFNRFATYNGSNPYKAPATLNVIPHLEHNIGAYFPIGGMHRISQCIYELACAAGVQFHFNSWVSRIVLDRKRATGVIVHNKTYNANVVVSNMDVYYTYHKLLPQLTLPAKSLSQEKSSSALIFYWGIERVFRQLELHNIFFSEDYAKEFAAIFEDKSISDDPTIYVNITSKYQASDAPSNCENWFVMINVPANIGQDWDALIVKARATIIAKLSRILGVDIGALISTEALLDPRSIESKTMSHQGALYGTSSNNRFAAFLRHPNFSRKISNVYFCGGSVHPGGGIPLCLLSAKIVASLVD